ncbi:EamA family transporter [Psychromicrobium xiongbiense]|uniref:EamA family transporter n=1 Tax=Psychromicrobium xiongbiense TaxID=3051184 RepID=UPI0025529E94|nr:EamA family transporter [Psychromicrobium sp. YIM S02556]
MKPKHALLAVLVAVIWGVNFLAIDAGLQSVPPLLFVAIRFILVIVPWIFFIKPPAVKWYIVVVVGLTMSAGQFGLVYLAMHLGLPTGLAPLVLQAQVLFTALIALAVLRERPTRAQWVGVGLGAIGLAVVGIGRAQVAPVLPFLLVLAGAFSWAVGNVIVRQVKTSSGLSMVVWSGAVVPLPLFLLSWFVEGPDQVLHALGNLQWPAILGSLFTAYVSTIVGYGIWNNLLSRYPAAAVGPYSLLIPPVGIAAAWLALGQAPSTTEIIGGALLLSGVAAAVLRLKRRSAGPPAAPLAAHAVMAAPVTVDQLEKVSP